MGYRSAIGAGFDPRRVPTQPVVLDRYHPLAQGLLGIWIPGVSPVNLVNKIVGTYVGAPTIGTSNFGPAMVVSSSQYLNTNQAQAQSGTNLTFSALAMQTTSVNQAIFGSSTFTDGFEVSYNAGNGAINLIKQQLVLIGGSTGLTTLNKMSHITATYDVSGNFTFTVDGASAGSGTNLQTVSPSSTLWLGGAGNSEWLSGSIAQAAVHQRVLPADERAWIAAEPFIMLRPVVRKQYYTQSGAAPPAVSLDMWHQPASQPYRVRAEMIPY